MKSDQTELENLNESLEWFKSYNPEPLIYEPRSSDIHFGDKH